MTPEEETTIQVLRERLSEAEELLGHCRKCGFIYENLQKMIDLYFDFRPIKDSKLPNIRTEAVPR